MKLIVEAQVSATDRIAKQPIFALADVCDKSEAENRPFEEPVKLTIPHLQLFAPFNDDPPKFVAQLLYRSGQYGIHEAYMQLCSQRFSAAFACRIAEPIRLIEVERSAIAQGSARSLPFWELTVDASGTNDSINHYPHTLSFHPVTDS